MDALRAHAVQAAANLQQQQSSSVNMHPPSSPMNPPPKVISDEVIKVEPDSEPIPEEDSQSSPVGPPRGPSPEPRIEDTECHRSQSAMYVKNVSWYFDPNILKTKLRKLNYCCES